MLFSDCGTLKFALLEAIVLLIFRLEGNYNGISGAFYSKYSVHRLCHDNESVLMAIDFLNNCFPKFQWLKISII